MPRKLPKFPTVAELIAKLQTMSPTAEVILLADEDACLWGGVVETEDPANLPYCKGDWPSDPHYGEPPTEPRVFLT